MLDEVKYKANPRAVLAVIKAEADIYLELRDIESAIQTYKSLVRQYSMLNGLDRKTFVRKRSYKEKSYKYTPSWGTATGLLGPTLLQQTILKNN